MDKSNRLAGDLEEVLARAGSLWEELRGARLFVTGGTGFFGVWLLESLAWANQRLNLGLSVTVLTRDPGSFEAKSPHLATDPAITLYNGDVRSFAFPSGAFSHVIHAATGSSGGQVEITPLEMFDTIVEGTRRVLDFAGLADVGRLLSISSGAVYGPQPSELEGIPEDFIGGPDPRDPRSAYGEGKRAAEWLCAAHSSQRICIPIARCWAFVGPYLPLDAHFAVGNFIRDALAGGPIRIGGDGTPFRSYLYASDLVVWLLTILLRGQSARAYNVGAREPITIRDLAQKVAECFEPRPAIVSARQPVPGVPVARYIPDTRRAEAELGLQELVGLRQALLRTVKWHNML